MNTALITGEVVVATTTATILTETLNLDSLYTALVSFAVSLVTIVGGELIKYLSSYLKNKTKKLEDEDKDKKE